MNARLPGFGRMGEGRSGGGIYDPDAAIVFAAMSVQPDDARKVAIDTLIRALKAPPGVWTKTDCLYVCAAHTSQAAKLNLINPAAFKAVAVNSPAFTVDRGFTGDLATSYLDSVFNPTLAGGQFTQDSAHMGVWIGTDVTSSSQWDCGNARSRMISRRSAVTPFVTANMAANDAVPAVASSVGWLCWSRQNSSSYDAVKDLDAPVNTVRVSAALNNSSFLMLAYNNSGTPANYSSRRVQAFHFGSFLNDAERDACRNALGAYMTAVGA